MPRPLRVALLLSVGAYAASSNTSSTTSTSTGVGDFIAQGLGIDSTTVASNLSTSAKPASNGTAETANGLPTAFPFSYPDPTWTVAASGTGSSYASACNTEQLYYQYLSSSALEYGPFSVTSASTSYWTIRNFSADITTLCDGHPHVLGTLTPTATITNSTVIEHSTSPNVPSPTCSVGLKDCQALFSSWSSALYSTTGASFPYPSGNEIFLDPAMTAIVTGDLENGDSTTVTLASGPVTSPPPLTISGTTYQADDDSTYWIQAWPLQFSPLAPNHTITMSNVAPGAFEMPQCQTYFSSSTPYSSILANQTAVTKTYSNSLVHLTTTEACDCTIAGNNVQLLYFPVTKNVSRNMCQTALPAGTICPFGDATVVDSANSISLIGSLEVDQGSACPYIPFNRSSTTNSGPYTVSAGTTYYENRAYISFEVISATRQCGYAGGVGGQLGTEFDSNPTTAFVGGVYSNSVVEVPSSDIYSGCGYSYFYDPRGYSFNFADLNEPVPASAYLCQPKCAEIPSYPSSVLNVNDNINGQPALTDVGLCELILDSEYKPNILVPPQMRALDPAWSTCVLKLEGLYDPPKALQPAVSEAVPTVNPGGGNGATSTPASPASTPPTSSPPKTSAAADNLPTTTANSPIIASTETSLDQPTSAAGGAASPSGSTSQDGSNATPTPHAGSDQVASPSAGNSDGGSGGNEESATTTQDAAGVIVSLLGGSSTANAGQTSNDPGSDPSAAGFGSNEDSAQSTTAQSGASATQGSAPAVTTFEVSGQAVTASQDPSDPNAVQVNGTPLTVGQAATVNGAEVSLASSGLVADGSVVAAASSSPAPAAATFQAGGSSITAQEAGGSAVLVAGNSTVSFDSNGVATGAGATVSNGGSGLVVDGSSTVALAGASQANAQPAASAATLGNQAISATTQANGQTAYVVGGSTLSEGGDEATVGGTVVSAGSAGLVVGGSSTLNLDSGATGVAAASQAVVTLGGQAITASQLSGGGRSIVVAGSTLTPGQVATVDGTVVSAGSSGLVVGGSQTVPLPAAAANTAQEAAFTGTDGQVLTASAVVGSSGAIIIDGTTLTQGGSAQVIDGATVSADANGIVVDGSRTIALTQGSSASAAVDAVTFTGTDGQLLSATPVAGSSSLVVVDGTTLTRGASAQVVDGVTISAGASGVVLNGTSTLPLSASASTSSGDPRTTQGTGASPSAGTGSSTTTSGSSASSRISIMALALLSVGVALFIAA